MLTKSKIAVIATVLGAADRSGLNAFASTGRAGFASDAPSSTGGGSVGATLRR